MPSLIALTQSRMTPVNLVILSVPMVRVGPLCVVLCCLSLFGCGAGRTAALSLHLVKSYYLCPEESRWPLAVHNHPSIANLLKKNDISKSFGPIFEVIIRPNC